MQGRGKFNRARFNLPTLQTEIAIREKQVVNVESAPDVGGDMRLKEDSGETLRGEKARIGFGVAAAARCAEILSAGIYLTRIYSLSGTLSVALGGIAKGTLDCDAGDSWRAVMRARPKVKGDNMIAEDCAVRVRAAVRAGANYTSTEWRGYEIMNASTSTAQFDTEYIEISIPIPPGSTLEINSDDFTVTLDGENVLHAQSGGWVMIDRDVDSLAIQFPSRASAAAMLEYTGRFL